MHVLENTGYTEFPWTPPPFFQTSWTYSLIAYWGAFNILESKISDHIGKKLLFKILHLVQLLLCFHVKIIIIIIIINVIIVIIIINIIIIIIIIIIKLSLTYWFTHMGLPGGTTAVAF